MHGVDARCNTLLLVTADRQLQHGLASVLEAQGFACIRAANGSVGAEMFRGISPPDAVVVDDDFLAGTDPLEFFRSFDGEDRESPMGFVLVSSGRFAELIPNGWESRLEILWMPFQMDDLLRAVNRALGVRALAG